MRGYLRSALSINFNLATCPIALLISRVSRLYRSRETQTRRVACAPTNRTRIDVRRISNGFRLRVKRENVRLEDPGASRDNGYRDDLPKTLLWTWQISRNPQLENKLHARRAYTTPVYAGVTGAHYPPPPPPPPTMNIFTPAIFS